MGAEDLNRRRTDGQLSVAMFGHKRIPSCEGGVEVVVEELSSRMVQMGHRVTCYNRSGHHVAGAEFDGGRLSEHKGVSLRRVFTIDRAGLAAMTSSVSAALRSAFGRYDVVHIHAEGPAAMAWLPKLFGKKVVVTIHGLDWQREKWKSGFASAYIRFGEKTAVRFADEIIVLSAGVQDYFRKNYGRQTRFVPNGVNEPQLCEADEITRRWGLEKDGYILYLGRLVPEKGGRYLIEAFRQVRTDKKLVIAGGISDTAGFGEELKRMAAGDDRIVFTGFVQGKPKHELYSNAYVYTLPSDLEGMPLSLLEAMSYGNCCLTSDIPECTQVVEDRAVTFGKGDVNELRRMLQLLCDDGEAVKEYKRGAREFILEKYSWDDAADKTVGLYL